MKKSITAVALVLMTFATVPGFAQATSDSKVLPVDEKPEELKKIEETLKKMLNQEKAPEVTTKPAEQKPAEETKMK